MTVHKFSFEYHDNGGKRQYFTVSAPDKAAAIEKGMKRAKKAARGDCIAWRCTLIK